MVNKKTECNFDSMLQDCNSHAAQDGPHLFPCYRYRTAIHMQRPGWGSSVTPLSSRVQDAFRLVVVRLISSLSYTPLVKNI
jgi:hypothetical protein